MVVSNYVEIRADFTAKKVLYDIDSHTRNRLIRYEQGYTKHMLQKKTTERLEIVSAKIDHPISPKVSPNICGALSSPHIYY